MISVPYKYSDWFKTALKVVFNKLFARPIYSCDKNYLIMNCIAIANSGG